MGATTPASWTTRERSAWLPPERLLPSQWAAKYRTLSRKQSSRWGRWNNEQAPYLIGIMDLPFRFPQIRKINIKKFAQGGMSEAIRNVFGCCAMQDPDPMMMVLPNKEKGREIFDKRLLPMFQETSALKGLSTTRSRDQKMTKIELANGFVLQLAWSGSPASLASDPVRIVVVDEVDKMARWVGFEASPVKLAEVRTATYANSIIYTLSTPTTREGQITQLEENSPIRLRYFVPCPHCNHLQKLVMGGLKFEVPEGLTRGKDKAAAILRDRSAWYECEGCHQRIEELHRPKMMNRGCWGTEDGSFKYFATGEVEGELPAGDEAGMQIPALYSLAAKHSWAEIAADFLKSKDDPSLLMNFINSTLGEVFEQERKKTEPDLIRHKAAGAGPAQVVPAWARLLVATADTQGTNDQNGYFWYTVRAWSYGYRSALVDFGVAHSKAELVQRTLERPWEIAGGGQASASGLWIDAGGPRWHEVYELAQADPRIRPTKGASHPLVAMAQESLQKAHGVTIWNIDTDQSKDLLHQLIHDPDRTRWMPHSQVNDDYISQMGSERKVFDPVSRRESWREVLTDRNHLWDCEHQQVAVAWRLGMGMPEPTAEESPDLVPAGGAGGTNFITSFKGRY